MNKPRGLTKTAILHYIQTEIRDKGYPPTVREIADAMGLASTSTVHGHLERLQRDGIIWRDPLKPRTLRIVG